VTKKPKSGIWILYYSNPNKAFIVLFYKGNQELEWVGKVQ
jgi:hypothetical protein